MTGTVVVAGATGFVGSHLVEHLLATGWTVRCGTRRPVEAAARWPDRTWVRLDLDDPASVDAAFAGASHVVHLVHHMGDARGDLVARERDGATVLARAAAAAGVARIVYLGAPVPPDSASAHLLARQATGEVLRAGVVPCVELRASMIVGVGSESWRIVRDLALRLPVMVLPTWLRSRTQPIGIHDVVAALARCLVDERVPAGIHDLPGPEILSARDILLRTAAADGRSPATVGVPVLTPALSSTWIRLVTRADMGIARKLVDGLATDLIMPGDGLYALCPDLPRTRFDDVARATIAAEGEVDTAMGRWWERTARRLTPRP